MPLVQNDNVIEHVSRHTATGNTVPPWRSKRCSDRCAEPCRLTAETISTEELRVWVKDPLAASNLSSMDPNYRTVMTGRRGNIIFSRDVGAPNAAKLDYYRQALVRYRKPRHFFRITRARC